MEDFITYAGVFFVLIFGLVLFGFAKLANHFEQKDKTKSPLDYKQLFELVIQHEARIKSLEKKLDIQTKKTSVLSAVEASPAAVKTAAEKPVSGEKGLEEAMAGKWFQWVALTALLFGLGYFFKLAFENNWITPIERIVLGWATGVIFLALGHHWFQKYPGWAHGLAGSGLAFLYLSTFAGYQYYSLFGNLTAFGVMVVTTVVGSVLAVVNRRAVLAVLAILGGFATPLLVSTNTNNEVGLMCYLLVLNAGVITVSIFGEWKFLRWIGFASTVFYGSLWSSQYYQSHVLWLTLSFYTLFYLLYSAASWLYDFQKRQDADSTDALFCLLNAAVYFGASYSMLSDKTLAQDYDWLSTLLALALGGFYAWQSYAVQKSKSKDAQYISSVFFGLAATFLAVAIPIFFEKEWITVGWSIEAVFLLWTGLKESRFSTRQIAYFVMALVVIRLVFFDWSGVTTTLIFNNRLIPYGAALGSVIASVLLLGRFKSKAPDAEWAIPTLAILGNLIALLYLSLEVSDYWNRQTFSTGWSPKGLSLSILWLFYATAMMLYGFWNNFRGLRLLAIMAFCVTILKVFLFDLSELQGGYRVVSLLILGSILLAVSFGYQQRSKKTKIKE